jgi:methylase of polypeptide subunit release factors
MPRRFTLNGYTVTFHTSVSHPRPLPGLSFFPLFRSASSEVVEHHSVLEMGAGAGIWSLLCLEQKAQVSASDLPSVCLDGLVQTSTNAGFSKPTLYYGDLFESIPKQSFDHIFFNPPFHFHTIHH